jgi:hypothetical protein
VKETPRRRITVTSSLNEISPDQLRNRVVARGRGITMGITPPDPHCKEPITKQIFPEKELRGHSPNFHINVSLSNLYITSLGLPFLQQEICMWTDPGNI